MIIKQKTRELTENHRQSYTSYEVGYDLNFLIFRRCIPDPMFLHSRRYQWGISWGQRLFAPTRLLWVKFPLTETSFSSRQNCWNSSLRFRVPNQKIRSTFLVDAQAYTLLYIFWDGLNYFILARFVNEWWLAPHFATLVDPLADLPYDLVNVCLRWQRKILIVDSIIITIIISIFIRSSSSNFINLIYTVLHRLHTSRTALLTRRRKPDLNEVTLFITSYAYFVLLTCWSIACFRSEFDKTFVRWAGRKQVKSWSKTVKTCFMPFSHLVHGRTLKNRPDKQNQKPVGCW